MRALIAEEEIRDKGHLMTPDGLMEALLDAGVDRIDAEHARAERMLQIERLKAGSQKAV